MFSLTKRKSCHLCSTHLFFDPVSPLVYTCTVICLQAQRKLSLSPEEEEAERQARGDVPDYARRKHFMPGYTGYIRGKQHIKGRTFGEATNRALERDYRELACTSPIPSDPAHNRKIPMARPSNTFVGAQKIGETMTHVPGYSGYIPRSRDAFGVTFGAISSAQLRSVNSTQDREIRVRETNEQTNKQMNEQMNELTNEWPIATHSMSTLTSLSPSLPPPYLLCVFFPPFVQDMEIEGRSRPLFRREMMKLDSAPLPGGIQTWNAPQKLVPAHLQHVRYLPY